MTPDITAAIAWRYLLSKKSHGAVATISTVSVCAMAVATAAIVCVLSVFNGFRDVITSKLDTLSPDIMVTAAKGKTFADAERLAARIGRMPGVAIATPTLSDNALVICNSHEMPVTLKGVEPAEYARVTEIRSLIDTDMGAYLPDTDRQDRRIPATIAIGVASRLRAYPEAGMLVFAPRREGRVNLANPASSFLSDSLGVTGIYHSDQQKFDEDGIIVPLSEARHLLQYDTEASAIEIKTAPGQNATDIAAGIQEQLGTRYVVKDRMRQQEMNFRMISIEKWVSFLLLGFILIIASFNLISSLSMVVIEKEKAMRTLTALGLSSRRIGSIFAWQSIYVSLAGGLAGIALGITLCLLQQHLGFITMGGDPAATIVHAYPVKVEPVDIAATFAPVILIGAATAAITATFAKSRINTRN